MKCEVDIQIEIRKFAHRFIFITTQEGDDEVEVIDPRVAARKAEGTMPGKSSQKATFIAW